MYHRFTEKQWSTLQEFLLENAIDSGIPLSEVAFIRCDPCLKCSVACASSPPWVAASRCCLCGGVLTTDSQGRLELCAAKECVSVRNYYGITIKYHGERVPYMDYSFSSKCTTTQKKCRELSARYLGIINGKKGYRGLSFEQLSLGMLLGFNIDVTKTVKKLREETNGPDRTGNN
jgi:hypothetical protein